MVCVDPTDGSKSRQPLTAINATRGKVDISMPMSMIDNWNECTKIFPMLFIFQH